MYLLIQWLNEISHLISTTNTTTIKIKLKVLTVIVIISIQNIFGKKMKHKIDHSCRRSEDEKLGWPDNLINFMIRFYYK